jgi:hypothetical protein
MAWINKSKQLAVGNSENSQKNDQSSSAISPIQRFPQAALSQGGKFPQPGSWNRPVDGTG